MSDDPLRASLGGQTPNTPFFLEAAAMLARHRRAVITAEPGAGKTTQLPLALLAHLAARGDQRAIWVLQPRRVAASLAARYVASLLGEPTGERVGYVVRYEQSQSVRTKLLFMTYGVFAQKLRRPDALTEVAAVLLDEFHERSWLQDAALAVLWARQQREATAPHLAVLSATLDAPKVAAYLNDAPCLFLPGRTFAVQTRYAPVPQASTLCHHAAKQALGEAQREPHGHVLAFFAGQRDIETTAAILSPLATPLGIHVYPLYARLPLAAQANALQPLSPLVRKIVLATNIAESSVTIDGVRTVIDSGEAFVAQHDGWTGMPSLRLGAVSKASADQRAGRAGRQGPGDCVRLYSAADYARRRPFDTPEVLRHDLSPMLLWLASLGLAQCPPPMLDAIPAGAWAAAHTLLVRMGALHANGAITDLGARMAGVPLPPRLARVALAGLEGGWPPARLADALAWLQEPPLFVPRACAAATTDSDLDDAMAHGTPTAAWHGARRDIERALRGIAVGPVARSASSDTLREALLAGYVDRLAKRLPPGHGPRATTPLALAKGGQAVLHPQSGVHKAPFLLCLAGRPDTTGAAPTPIYFACGIEPDALLARNDGALQETSETRLSPGGRALRRSQLRYDGLLLLEHDVPEPDPQRRADVWRLGWAQQKAQHAALQPFCDALWARLQHLGRHQPALLALADEWKAHGLARAIDALAQRAEALADLTAQSVQEQMQHQLPAALQDALRVWAPLTVRTRAGVALAVQWPAHGEPFVQSFVQSFYGHDAPLVLGASALALTVHLWAPNRRAVQQSRDLPNFWREHYPKLRPHWLRRYPKHFWPADPAHAVPPKRR